MHGTIIFRHDTMNDIIVAMPKWNIVTKEDCEIWYHQWVDYLSQFNRKMDVIMVLDEFNVDEQIASEWGEYRARLTIEYMRFSCQVNPNLNTGIFIRTSGMRYHAALQDAKNLESAYEAIKADRQNEGNEQ
jgi:hypothetical protein